MGGEGGEGEGRDQAVATGAHEKQNKRQNAGAGWARAPKQAKQQTLCSTNCSLVHKTTKIDVTEIRNRNPGVVSSFVLGTRILIGSTIDSIMLNTRG